MKAKLGLPRRLRASALKLLALLLSGALSFGTLASAWAADAEKPFNPPRFVSRPLGKAPRTGPKLPSQEALTSGTPLPKAPALPPAAVPAAKPAPEGSPEKSPVLGKLNLSAAEAGKADAKDASGVSGNDFFIKVYNGAEAPDPAQPVLATPLGPRPPGEFVANFEGIWVTGRAAYMLNKIREYIGYLKTLDLSDTIDVMDKSYQEVLFKLRMLEAISQGRVVEKHGTHIPHTLDFIDGVMDDGGRRVAMQFVQVYFHPNKGNPRSEIEEGKRRVAGVIQHLVAHYAPGGLAERTVGPLDEVVLGFDTGGYPEVKEFIKAEAAKHRGRFRFVFEDETLKAPMPRKPDEVRRQLNAVILRHAAEYMKNEGVGKILDGVIYSRKVGLLLELVSLRHRESAGFRTLLSGRDIFDDRGLYLTEFDAVDVSPAGEVNIVEDKSARIPLPYDVLMKTKVHYKLETYRSRKAELVRGLVKELEKALQRAVALGNKERATLIKRALARIRARGTFDKVVFVLDLGPMGRPGSPNQFVNAERAQANKELADKIKAQESSLSRKYGFPVEFLFLEAPFPPRELSPARSEEDGYKHRDGRKQRDDLWGRKGGKRPNRRERRRQERARRFGHELSYWDGSRLFRQKPEIVPELQLARGFVQQGLEQVLQG